jgi:hypothetical protein
MAACIAALFSPSNSDLPSWVTAAFTFVIAVATITYVWITHKLWTETKRSAEAAMVAANAAKLSAETSAALHRPFLGLVCHLFENNPISINRQFPVELRNFGTIPALRVGAVFELFIEQRSIYTSNEPESAEIFPDSAYERNLHLQLSIADVNLLQAGMKLSLSLRYVYEAPDGRRFEYTAEGPLGEFGNRFLLFKSETRNL